MKTLFILKRREDYSSDPSYSGSYQIATGMWNSAKFVSDALNNNGVDSDVELAVDANDIDMLCVLHNPDVVFIEGLWVTPEKFIELMVLPRHANRKFIVRIHSEIPFLATEGVAMDWIGRYLKAGVTVAPNAPRAHQQIQEFAKALAVPLDLVPLLPNYYPTTFRSFSHADLECTGDTLEVGCFGALRPLKNHLQQAMVAMQFAELLGKKLRFHINLREDQGGSPILRNLRGLFDHLPNGELIEHGWEDRATFLASMAGVHLLMQDALTETFNIVAADATLVGRPVLSNSEIPWLYPLWSDPLNQEKSLEALKVLWSNKSYFINQNRLGLTLYSENSLNVWKRILSAFS